MRISYLFSQFPLPTQGFAVSDIAALRELGHEVCVHTMKPPRRDEAARIKAASVPDDLPIFRPDKSTFSSWPALLWRWRRHAGRIAANSVKAFLREPKQAVTSILCIGRILEIVEEIERLDSDVVHLFWSRYTAHVLDILEHLDSPRLRSAFVGAYDLVANDFLVATALRSAETVFTHSEANRDALQTRTDAEKPISVIYRGIPLFELDETAPRDPNLWLTASALVKDKNVATVIEAFSRACKTHPDLRLAVCGDGPERRNLEELAGKLGCRSAITFEGHVAREQVFALSQRAGLFLMLSTKASERLPNVVKEAMWGGCAIITSPTPGIEELVLDDELGAIVAPDNTAALDNAIARAIAETPAMAEARCKRARALIQERFSNITSMGKYVAAWEQARGTVADDPVMWAAQ